MDGQYLHNLVKQYTENMLKLRGKTRHPRRPKLAAARSAAANFARRLCRVFPRNFGVIFNQIVQRFVHQPYDVVLIIFSSFARNNSPGRWEASLNISFDKNKRANLVSVSDGRRIGSLWLNQLSRSHSTDAQLEALGACFLFFSWFYSFFFMFFVFCFM